METFTYFVPVDFTESCYNALQYTTTLARRSGGTVKLCHVIDLEEIPESDNPIIVSFAIDRLLQDARKKMKSLREIIFMEGIQVKEEIALGNLHTELMKQIEAVTPSVVVVGRDVNKEPTSQSVLTYLTRNTTSPVLVVPQSYASKTPGRAILTVDLEPKKNGRFSAFTELIKRFQNFFSVLEVKTLHFGNGKEALQWIEMMRTKGNISPKFLSSNDDKRINQMIDFIQDNKIDIFCIQGSRNIFSKLFRQQLPKQLPAQVSGPVLVITL
ncbi:MAG TPA: universal stress protein [Chryseolinea sp.]